MQFILPVFLMLLFHIDFVFAKKSEVETRVSYNRGSDIVLAFLGNNKSYDTTSLRQEQKTVVDKQTIRPRISNFIPLEAHNTKPKNNNNNKGSSDMVFQLRENLNPEKEHLTYTVYGKKIIFTHKSVKTNIKLRGRFYLEKDAATGLVKRSPITKDKFFLELKVKNARLEEKNVSRKIRYLIPDHLLNQLIRVKTESQLLDFFRSMRSFISDKKNIQLFENFSQSILLAFRACPNFIDFKHAISYRRQAFKSVNSAKKNMESQLTIDDHIVVYKVIQDNILDEVNHLKSKNILYQYPEDIYFIEYKTPFTSKFLIQSCTPPSFGKLIADLFSGRLSKGTFSVNKGKLAQASTMF